MAEAKGLLSRVVLHPHGKSDELATITVWADRSSYEAWQEHNRASNVHRDAENPYVGSPETHILESISSISMI